MLFCLRNNEADVTVDGIDDFSDEQIHSTLV